MSIGDGVQPCRKCSHRLDEVVSVCPACGQQQRISCPSCSEAMELLHVVGVTVDVCRSCKLVWFDRGELGRLCRDHSPEVQAQLASSKGELRVDAISDTLAASSDLLGVMVEVVRPILTKLFG
jgi:Zn-finger nucleic acid-binding protein